MAMDGGPLRTVSAAARHRERERRDRRVEMRAVVGQHLVAALHGADRSFEHRAAGVAEALAGQQVRLLADHAFAAHFLDLAVRVGDHPVTRQQPRRHLAFVADGDRVGKGVVAFLGLGLLADIVGADVDADLVERVGRRPRPAPARWQCVSSTFRGCAFLSWMSD